MISAAIPRYPWGGGRGRRKKGGRGGRVGDGRQKELVENMYGLPREPKCHLKKLKGSEGTVILRRGESVSKTGPIFPDWVAEGNGAMVGATPSRCLVDPQQQAVAVYE